jgi:hypothetical protein
MIRHRLFTKGEQINVLISNNRYSNIVFPVKAIIHDVEFNDKMPRYQVRILKFYDDIDFLKRYMFDMKFEKNFINGGVTTFRIARSKISSIKEFQNYIDVKWESYLIVVDSVMCVKTYDEIIKLYNSIQDFLVEKTIKDLYELTNRSTYSTGKYHYKSKGIFEAHIKKFLGDRAGTEKKYFEKLLHRPLSIDYDNLE